MDNAVEVGIFYIPRRESSLYQQLTEIVGWDIWSAEVVNDSLFLPYGAHVTLADVTSIAESNLSDLVEKARLVALACGDGRNSQISMKNPRVEFWKNRHVVISYVCSPGLMALHAALAHLQHAFSRHSVERAVEKPSEARKAISGSQHTLTDYFPHFTLITLGSPSPTSRSKLIHEYSRRISPPDFVTIDSLAIVLRDRNGFRVHEEIEIGI